MISLKTRLPGSTQNFHFLYVDKRLARENLHTSHTFTASVLENKNKIVVHRFWDLRDKPTLRRRILLYIFKKLIFKSFFYHSQQRFMDWEYLYFIQKACILYILETVKFVKFQSQNLQKLGSNHNSLLIITNKK